MVGWKIGPAAKLKQGYTGETTVTIGSALVQKPEAV